MPTPASIVSHVQIGDEVQVWWPDDAVYYDGRIAAYLPEQQRHRVNYTDGDIEDLYLPNERWRFIGKALEREIALQNPPNDTIVIDGDDPPQPSSPTPSRSSDDDSDDVFRPPSRSNTTPTRRQRRKTLDIPPTPPVRAAAVAAMAAVHSAHPHKRTRRVSCPARQNSRATQPKPASRAKNAAKSSNLTPTSQSNSKQNKRTPQPNVQKVSQPATARTVQPSELGAETTTPKTAGHNIKASENPPVSSATLTSAATNQTQANYSSLSKIALAPKETRTANDRTRPASEQPSGQVRTDHHSKQKGSDVTRTASSRDYPLATLLKKTARKTVQNDSGSKPAKQSSESSVTTPQEQSNSNLRSATGLPITSVPIPRVPPSIPDATSPSTTKNSTQQQQRTQTRKLPAVRPGTNTAGNSEEKSNLKALSKQPFQPSARRQKQTTPKVVPIAIRPQPLSIHGPTVQGRVVAAQPIARAPLRPMIAVSTQPKNTVSTQPMSQSAGPVQSVSTVDAPQQRVVPAVQMLLPQSHSINRPQLVSPAQVQSISASSQQPIPVVTSQTMPMVGVSTTRGVELQQKAVVYAQPMSIDRAPPTAAASKQRAQVKPTHVSLAHVQNKDLTVKKGSMQGDTSKLTPDEATKKNFFSDSFPTSIPHAGAPAERIQKIEAPVSKIVTVTPPLSVGTSQPAVPKPPVAGNIVASEKPTIVAAEKQSISTASNVIASTAPIPSTPSSNTSKAGPGQSLAKEQGNTAVMPSSSTNLAIADLQPISNKSDISTLHKRKGHPPSSLQTQNAEKRPAPNATETPVSKKRKIIGGPDTDVIDLSQPSPEKIAVQAEAGKQPRKGGTKESAQEQLSGNVPIGNQAQKQSSVGNKSVVKEQKGTSKESTDQAKPAVIQKDSQPAATAPPLLKAGLKKMQQTTLDGGISEPVQSQARPIVSSLASKNGKNKRPRSVGFHQSVTSSEKNLSRPAPALVPPTSCGQKSRSEEQKQSSDNGVTPVVSPKPTRGASAVENTRSPSSKQSSGSLPKALSRQNTFKPKAGGRVVQNAERGTASMPLDILMKTITKSNMSALEAQLSPLNSRMESLFAENAAHIGKIHNGLEEVRSVARSIADEQKAMQESLANLATKSEFEKKSDGLRSEMNSLYSSEMSRMCRDMEERISDRIEKKIEQSLEKSRMEMRMELENCMQSVIANLLKDQLNGGHSTVQTDAANVIELKGEMKNADEVATQATVSDAEAAAKTKAAALAQATAERLSSRMETMSDVEVVKSAAQSSNMVRQTPVVRGESAENERDNAGCEVIGLDDDDDENRTTTPTKAFSRGRVSGTQDTKSEKPLKSLQPRSTKGAMARARTATGVVAGSDGSGSGKDVSPETSQGLEEGQIVERKLNPAAVKAGTVRDPGKYAMSERNRTCANAAVTNKSKVISWSIEEEDEFCHRAMEAKHLIGKMIVEWLLQGLCREKAPTSEREQPVAQDWVEQVSMSCLSHISTTLGNIGDFRTGMEQVTAKLRNVHLEIGWLLTAPTTENIARARYNYKGWVPKLLDFEWESEKRVITLMAENILKAQQKLMTPLLKEKDPLVLAVRFTKEAARINNSDSL